MVIKMTILLASLLLVATSLCYGEEETFTITTYYPSPYGSYNELSTNKFVVGDADGDGKITSTDQPSITGDIRLKPQSGDPATWSAGKTGEVAYSSMDGYLYTHNGSKWVAQGGGTTYFLACDNCPTGTTEIASVRGGIGLQGVASTEWVEDPDPGAPIRYVGITAGAEPFKCCKKETAGGSISSNWPNCIKICKF